jgi:hypothetical protein
MRVAVTLLDEYRRFVNFDYISESEMIAKIKGAFTPSRPMELGTAFHAIIEDPQEHYIEGYGMYVAPNGIEFGPEVIEGALPYITPGGVFEVKATKDYHVNGELVTVVAKADKLVNAEVEEQKTRWSAWDIDSYLDSYQWRWYLEIFEAVKVKYNVFRLSETDRNGIVLHGVEQFSLFPYPALQSDCRALLSSFVEFAKAKKLTGYLVARG